MNKEVFRTWSMILQIGITILVPLFLLVALGYFLKEQFNIDIMLITVIVGILTGVRNAYVILRNYLKTMGDSKNKESELLKKHKKSIKK